MAVTALQWGERDPGRVTEFVHLHTTEDDAALIGFDLYVAYREHLCELRINEVKRTIPWSVGRRKTG